jgi:hypothetical protein
MLIVSTITLEPVAQGDARRPAREELRHLQRLRRDDDPRLHPQRPDPARPDRARHGRQRRVQLTAAARGARSGRARVRRDRPVHFACAGLPVTAATSSPHEGVRGQRVQGATIARLVVAGRVSGGPPNLFTTLGRHPRLAALLLRAPDAGRSPVAAGRRVRDHAGRVAVSPYEWQQPVPRALRVGLTPDARDRRRDLYPLRPAHAPGRDVERRPRESRRPRGDRTPVALGHYQGLASTIGALGIEVEQGPQPS